ncbi:MAG: DUF2723 domain-containing protein [Deltaproteobacteria bacterium]|jgi:tetratricopeptide (TPR) repeat protein|nr:DUF2723 domain-containing protein [Deltaproteobacteria bacterium]
MMDNKISKKLNCIFNSDNSLYFLFFCLLIFYSLCATPSVGWRDGPELVETAVYLDIAHPAGFPTYNLLAKIFCWIPLGSLGFRLNLFSAVAGAATVLLLGFFLKKIHQFDGKKETKISWLFVPLPFFALCQGIWLASVEVEVYSLNLFFVIALLGCALLWYDGYGQYWLYFGGFLYGLACGNHASLALYLPVLLILTFWGQPNKGDGETGHGRLGRVFILAAVFLVGLSVYLLLLVRGQAGVLPFNFGDVHDLETFWYHISDQKDSDYHTKSILNLEKLFFYLNIQSKKLFHIFFIVGIPFVLWGIKYLWEKYQALVVSLILLVFINLGFFFYWIDGSSAFLPSILAIFIFLSVGLGQFARFLIHLSISRTIIVAGAVAVVLAGGGYFGLQRFCERDSEAGFTANEMFWSDFAEFPPESLTVQSSNYFSFLALQYIYSVRPDVSVINYSSVTVPKYTPQLTPQKFPMVVFPLLPDGALMPRMHKEFASSFFSVNIDAGKDVFFQYSFDVNPIIQYLRPDLNYLWQYRLYKDEDASKKAVEDGEYAKLMEQLISTFTKYAASTDPPFSKKAPAYLFYMLLSPLSVALENEDLKSSEELLTVFINEFIKNEERYIVPHDVKVNAHGYYAEVLYRQGRLAEAISVLEKVIALDPSLGIAYYQLGRALLENGQIDRALEAMCKATIIDEFHLLYLHYYVRELSKHKSLNDASAFLDERYAYYTKNELHYFASLVDYYRNCVSLDPEFEDVPSGNPFLNKALKMGQSSNNSLLLPITQ